MACKAVLHRLQPSPRLIRRVFSVFVVAIAVQCMSHHTQVTLVLPAVPTTERNHPKLLHAMTCL